MRFVNDDQVPTGFGDLPGALFRSAEEADAGNDELFVLERIATRITGFDRFAALFIKQRKLQVEAPQEFDKPLVDQTLRQQDQHAADSSAGEQAGQDHSGFDGFAQPHFIGKQDT